MQMLRREENIDTLEEFAEPDEEMKDYVKNYAKKKMKKERASMIFWVFLSLFFVSFYANVSSSMQGQTKKYMLVVAAVFGFTIFASIYRCFMVKDAEEKFERGEFLYREVFVKRVSSFEGLEEGKKVLKITEEKEDGTQKIYSYPFKVKKWKKGEKMDVIKYKKGRKGDVNGYFLMRTLENVRKEEEEKEKEKEEKE